VHVVAAQWRFWNRTDKTCTTPCGPVLSYVDTHQRVSFHERVASFATNVCESVKIIFNNPEFLLIIVCNVSLDGIFNTDAITAMLRIEYFELQTYYKNIIQLMLYAKFPSD
jgi:hypothetical protein